MSHDFEPTDAEKEMMTLAQSSPTPHTNVDTVLLQFGFKPKDRVMVSEDGDRIITYKK